MIATLHFASHGPRAKAGIRRVRPVRWGDVRCALLVSSVPFAVCCVLWAMVCVPRYYPTRCFDSECERMVCYYSYYVSDGVGERLSASKSRTMTDDEMMK